MEHQITFVDEPRCAVIKIIGEPTFTEVHHGLRTLLTYPQWEPGIDMFVDCRETEYKHLTASTIRDLARTFTKDTRGNGPGHLALVVRRELGFGLARMWEMLINPKVGYPIQVFNSMEDAKEWLGLQDVQFSFNGQSG